MIEDNNAMFSEPGDSGGIVWDGERRAVVGIIIVGIVHAEVDGRWWDNIAVITPAEEILR